MTNHRTAQLGTLAAVVAATLFGMLGPLARFGAEAGVEGVAFTAWRAALGVGFLAVLIAIRGGAGSSLATLGQLSPRGRAALATAALMGLTLNASMFTAFGLVPIALVLMLFYLYPAGVVVIDLALGHERLSAARVLALALSFGGVVLVLGGSMGGAGAPLDPLGIALGLVAAASQVVFVSLTRGGYSSVPADAATLVVLLASTVGASTIAVLVGQGTSLVVPLRSLEPWPVLVVAGVVAAGMSSLLFMTAIRTIGGTRTGILMLLEPVVGVLLAAWILGEALAPVQAAGAGLVLAGALVLQLRSAPAREPIAETGASPVV